MSSPIDCFQCLSRHLIFVYVIVIFISHSKVPKTLVTMMDTPVILQDPYGVVLVIGSWNYPIQLGLIPVSGAIAAGNCVIIKPSEIAPASSKLLEEIVPKYLDPVRKAFSP